MLAGYIDISGKLLIPSIPYDGFVHVLATFEIVLDFAWHLATGRESLVHYLREYARRYQIGTVFNMP